MRFSTKAIHIGQEPDPATGSVTVPIVQTSTYAQEAIGINTGFEYSRAQNPTRFAVEMNFAALEGASYAFAFSSGLAAIDTVLRMLSSGDHVIAASDMYGGTYRLFHKILTRFGLEFSFVDQRHPDAVSRAVKKNTKMIYTETPSNPMMLLTDLDAIAAIAKAQNLITVCDNTFATPYLQSPIAQGIDVVMHSTTKYMGGHSDLIGGALMTSNDAIAEQLKFLQFAIGAVPSPFECWLLLRSSRTLGLRMKQHCENAMTLAHFLEDHPRVTEVHYPGLTTHPQHALAQKQMRGFGGMISFETDSLESANNVARSLKVITLAESLGGVESLICHPASMTHASVPKEKRDAIGIHDGLLRLSVGLEDVEDLEEDLAQALKA